MIVPEPIQKKRNELERELLTRLIDIHSDLTTADLLEVIYQEEGPGYLRGVENSLMPFSDPDDEVEPTEEAKRLAKDLWHYFPHKSLNARSPAEADSVA